MKNKLRVARQNLNHAPDRRTHKKQTHIAYVVVVPLIVRSMASPNIDPKAAPGASGVSGAPGARLTDAELDAEVESATGEPAEYYHRSPVFHLKIPAAAVNKFTLYKGILSVCLGIRDGKIVVLLPAGQSGNLELQLILGCDPHELSGWKGKGKLFRAFAEREREKGAAHFTEFIELLRAQWGNDIVNALVQRAVEDEAEAIQCDTEDANQPFYTARPTRPTVKTLIRAGVS